MQDRFYFRAWTGTQMLSDVAVCNGVYIRADWSEYDDFIVMQSTGLKDKNGKLIYEGDIVKFKTELFGKPKQIIWDECHYILKNTFIILCDMEIKQFGLEVIGNIYENKELLESEGV